MSSWSSHAIRLEGCGGPAFQLIVKAVRQDPRLTEADLTTLSYLLPRLSPTDVQVCANRDEWKELNDAVWIAACHKFENIESFGFTTMYCRRGYNDTKVGAVLTTCTQLKELVVQDGIYGYTETFQNAKMAKLEKMVLRDVSFGYPVDAEWSEALASLIRTAPLRNFELSNVLFESQACWDVVFQALMEKEELEDIKLYRLKSLEDLEDFAPSASEHPLIVEKRNVAKYLSEHYSYPYSMSQRLQALLHVRTDGSVELMKARCSETDCNNALALLNDKMDYCFQFLRHEADPTTWALTSRAA